MSKKRGADETAHTAPPAADPSSSRPTARSAAWRQLRPVHMDRVAPCNQRCPIGIDIEGYMNLLREGRTTEALDLLLRENPLPAVTGRVCYHPCEGACHRQNFDEAVAIHAVERVMGDMALEQSLLPGVEEPRPERVGVVGSGPAGLACAYHLAVLGYKVTVFEAEAEVGGILRYGIPEYRLPRNVLAREVSRIRQLGVEFRTGVRIGQEIPWAELDAWDAVFLATGVSRSRSLGREYDRIAGVRSGLEFLKEISRGHRPEIGRRVIVVGGGATAIDCARTALRLGAEVTVLYRRTRQEMPANPEEVEEALADGVRFEFLAVPAAARTEEVFSESYVMDAIRAMYGAGEALEPDVRLRGIDCLRVRLGEPDASGRRRPEPVVGSQFQMPADTLLMALGAEPELEIIPPEIRRVASTVQVDGLGGTTRVAFFAGGDLTDEPHTVAWAIGSGKRAALGIDRHLQRNAQRKRRAAAPEPPTAAETEEYRLGEEGNVSATRWRGDDPVQRVGDSHSVVAFENLNLNHFETEPRHADPRIEPAARKGNFTEVNVGLSPEEALAEAGRCFNCGVCNGCETCLIFCADVAIHRRADGSGFTVDYEFCKGCGTCAAECPRGAITMTEEPS